MATVTDQKKKRGARWLFISYDNGSHIPFFPLNIFYLMGALTKEGHTVGVWHQDLHHGSESALTQILNQNEFDFVALGFVAGYYQYSKALKISAAINASKNRLKFAYVLGGHGPAAEPEWFRQRIAMDSKNPSFVSMGEATL